MAYHTLLLFTLTVLFTAFSLAVLANRSLGSGSSTARWTTILLTPWSLVIAFMLVSIALDLFPNGLGF